MQSSNNRKAFLGMSFKTMFSYADSLKKKYIYEATLCRFLVLIKQGQSHDSLLLYGDIKLRIYRTE